MRISQSTRPGQTDCLCQARAWAVFRGAIGFQEPQHNASRKALALFMCYCLRFVPPHPQALLSGP